MNIKKILILIIMLLGLYSINEIETPIIEINRKNNEKIKLNMNDYLIGVLGAEIPASFNIEAIKANAIVARTYALKNKDKLTDTISTQAYNDNNELKNKWKEDYQKYYDKIKQAVKETENLVITYNNELIDALYFSTSNGKTEAAQEVFGYDVPYLQSVDSNFDTQAKPYFKTEEKTLLEVVNLLGVSNLNNIEILSKTESGRIKKIKIGDKIYNGTEIRKLLNLRSTDFNINVEGEKVLITTRGYGHGVGMSQYGANSLAQLGYTYSDIIHFYYKNVEIKTLDSSFT